MCYHAGKWGSVRSNLKNWILHNFLAAMERFTWESFHDGPCGDFCIGISSGTLLLHFREIGVFGETYVGKNYVGKNICFLFGKYPLTDIFYKYKCYFAAPAKSQKNRQAPELSYLRGKKSKISAGFNIITNTLDLGQYPHPEIPIRQMLWILTLACLQFQGDYWLRHIDHLAHRRVCSDYRWGYLWGSGEGVCNKDQIILGHFSREDEATYPQ